MANITVRAVHRNAYYHTDGGEKYVTHESQISVDEFLCCAMHSMNTFCRDNKNKLRFAMHNFYFRYQWKTSVDVRV